MLATMKMTSLGKLRDTALEQAGGLEQLTTIVENYDQSKEALQSKLEECRSVASTLSSSMKALSEKQKEPFRKELKEVTQSMNSIKGEINELDRNKEALEGIQSIEQGIADGHTDLLELHLEKLKEAVDLPKNAHIQGPKRELFKQAIHNIEQFNTMANRLEKRHDAQKTETTKKRPHALTEGQDAACGFEAVSPEMRGLAVVFMKKASAKISLFRQGTPKAERLRYLLLQTEKTPNLNKEQLRDILLEFTKTAALSSNIVDANSHDSNSATASAMFEFRDILDKVKPTNSGTACFKALGDNQFADLTQLMLANDREPIKNYDQFMDKLKKASTCPVSMKEEKPDGPTAEDTAPTM